MLDFDLMGKMSGHEYGFFVISIPRIVNFHNLPLIVSNLNLFSIISLYHLSFFKPEPGFIQSSSAIARLGIKCWR